MFVYSRTARIEDHDVLEIGKNILRYAETKKNFTLESKPRYKFWDYSLVIELARQEHISNILDIGNGNDITYDILCRYHQINLSQLSLKEFKKLPIRDNKVDFITLFAVLEHVDNIEQFLKKTMKYISRDGFLVITTDEELIDRHKKNIITSETLLEISLICEDKDFELYPYEVDYLEKGDLHSLVMRRTG